MVLNNAADTLNASLTFNGAVFTVNSPTINIGTNLSTVTINGTLILPSLAAATSADILYYNAGVITYGALPVAAAAWLLDGNTISSSNFMGSVNPEDVVFKAANTEVFRMVNADGSLKLAANGLVDTYPSAVVCGASSSGALTLYGGPSETGAQLTLTSAGFPESSVIAMIGNASFYLTSFSSPPYALLSPTGIQIGNASFGDATYGVLSMQGQVSNPTTIGGSSGMLFVGSDSNLYYLNSTATYQLTPLGGASWLTSGANTGSGLLLGNTDTNSWSMQSNSVVFFTVDQFQDITITSGDWSLTADGDITEDGLGISLGQATATSIGIGWSGSNVTVDGSSIDFTAANNLLFNSNTGYMQFESGTTIAMQSVGDFGIGTSNGNIQIQAGGATNNVSLISSLSEVILQAATTLEMTASSEADLDAPLILIGANVCTSLNFGNAATASTLVGTQWEAQLTTAFVEDAPSIQIGSSSNTIFQLGNVNTDLSISSAQTSILGQTYVDIDSAIEVQIATSDATILQIANPTTVTTFDATSLSLANLPIATTANVVYVGVSGQLSSGAAPSLTLPGPGVIVTNGGGSPSAVGNYIDTGNSGQECLYLGLNTSSAANSGGQSLGIGYGALSASTPAANFNTAVGYGSQQNCVNGQENTSIGTRSLQSNIDGINNVALGCYALVFNTHGSGCIAIGNAALENNLIGNNNFGLGNGAGQNQSACNDCIFIGVSSNATANYNDSVGLGGNTSISGNNSVAIGANSSVTADNNIVLGNGCSVVVGNTQANSSAILDLESTTQGFLPPQMSTTQKTAISSPAAGLVVYDNTLNQLSYYNGTIWINLT
jgi:hypothetical protein